jgi:hypothetical protein
MIVVAFILLKIIRRKALLLSRISEAVEAGAN